MFYLMLCYIIALKLSKRWVSLLHYFLSCLNCKLAGALLSQRMKKAEQLKSVAVERYADLMSSLSGAFDY